LCARIAITHIQRIAEDFLVWMTGKLMLCAVAMSQCICSSDHPQDAGPTRDNFPIRQRQIAKENQYTFE
jgi:hypothetical protein